MSVVVCGSIATDHLMRFPGRFAEQLLPDQLHRVSLSFLVDDLIVRRGGVAANIAFGMAQLGQQPTLVGAVGPDFADYRAWLERHGVDCTDVLVSESRHTARFVCTTDDDMCQIASFYSGAMSEAAQIELAPIIERTAADLVVIGADDPAAMTRHTQECQQRGFPFVADPSQQIARMTGPDLVGLVDGADILLTNAYERELLGAKTGLSRRAMLACAGVQITTLGPDGVEISGRDIETVIVPAAKELARLDPTGVGDGFRAGLLAARSRGLGWERAAQVGHLLAAHVLETVGTQEYRVDAGDFAERLAQCYGDDAAAEVDAVLWTA